MNNIVFVALQYANTRVFNRGRHMSQLATLVSLIDILIYYDKREMLLLIITQ